MDKKKTAELLKSLPLAQHIPPNKLNGFLEFLQPVPIENGQIIFEEGSQGDSLFLIAEGKVRIEKKSGVGEKEQKQLAFLGTGDFFGEMALIEEIPRSAQAVAETDVLLFKLEKKALFKWLKSQPKEAVGFFVELVRVLSQRLRRTSQELTLLFDLSHLVLEKYASRREFISKMLREIIRHLEGSWSGGAYLYNEFNQEMELICTEGPTAPTLPPQLSNRSEGPTGWISPSTYCVLFPGKPDPMGVFLFQNKALMSLQEKNDIAVTLTATAHLASSCLENLQHQEEEVLKQRLKIAHGGATF
ncbi:MAG: Crp/Fnr family transcriptional regulator [Elusimicrobia bacterium]|nr:Crp/Fnr family transcriptional regulator [Elusimicrobiota bacterium]